MINQVFEIREVSLSYEASGGAGTLEIFTDLPGGAMAERGSDISLPITTGGKGTASKTIDFEGTTCRVKITPNVAGTLRPYSGSLMVRRIGVHLDGTRGEYFETQDIALSI